MNQHCHATNYCKQIAVGDCVECGKPVCAVHALKKSGYLFCSAECWADSDVEGEVVK